MPNVLFVIVHDIGRRLGAYGDGQARTPHLDALAARSMRFDNHFCQFPLCGPSRANLFSGCRPPTTRRFDNEPFFPEFRRRMGTGFRSLPQHFREAGYRTLGAGLVYHDLPDPPSWSEPLWRPDLMQEVAEWARAATASAPNLWRARESLALLRGRLENLRSQGFSEEELLSPRVLRKARGPAVEGPPVEDRAYPDGRVTDKAAEWLERGLEEPFFLAVGYIGGHLPWNVPARYWELYDRAELRLAENPLPPAGSPEWAMGDSEPAQYYTQNDYQLPWRADRAQSRELLHGHLAAVSYFDAQVGRLLEALRRGGLEERTVVAVTSDHGYHDGEHGYWGKHNLWERSLAVPLLLRVPELTDGGASTSGLTEHVDLYPTLCELCGLERPAFLEGDSFLPLLSQPRRPWKPAAFAHRRHQFHDRLQVYDAAHSVRTGRFRLNVYSDPQGRILAEELFDYQEDPLELANHAQEQRFRGEVRELEAMIENGWRRFRPG